jgi:hypothetical protein
VIPFARDPKLKELYDQLRAEAILLHLDPEDLALVENIGANLGQEIRPTRNDLEAGIEAGHDYDQLVEETDIVLTPREEQNLQFSFEGHLKAMARSTADNLGAEMEAEQFFAIGDDPKKEPLILKMKEHAQGNYPNLGPHPASEMMPIPIPPGMEKQATRSAEILRLPPSQRKRAMKELLDLLSDEAKA